MAVGEIFAKGLVVIKGDTSHARAEVAKLSLEEQKAAKARIKAQEEHNAALERSNQRFQLYAAGAVAGWVLISKSVKTYEEHLKSLGASGESELKRIKGASDALTGAQKNLEIAIAKVALEAAPAAKALGSMAQEMANLVGGVAAFIAKVKEMPVPGGGSVGDYVGAAWNAGSWWNENWSPWGMSKNIAMGGANWIGGGKTDPLGRSDAEAEARVLSRYADTSTPGAAYLDPQQRQDAIFYLETALARAESALRRGNKAGARARRGRGGRGGGAAVDPYAAASADIFGQIGATSGYSSGRYSQEDLDAIGLGAEPVAPAMGWEGVSVPQSVLDNLARTQEELLGDRRQTMLESIFGPVEEVDAYAVAFQGLETVVSAGFEAWISGSKSVGAAMKEALHGFAKNLAGEALLQALRHGAYALGSLAFGDAKGAAAHGISAAKWGAVAVAAGVVGKVTAPSASATGNSYAAAGIGGGGVGSGSSDRNFSMTVVMGDQFAGDSPRYVARKVRRNLNMARMYADYESEGN